MKITQSLKLLLIPLLITGCRSQPNSQVINSRLLSINELSQKIADGVYGKYDALLISVEDSLVFESYYREGIVDQPHRQASVSKGYVSLAVGRAIQLKHLTWDDLKKPIAELLKDTIPNNWAAGTELITMRHLLSMQSGIRLSEEQKKQISDSSKIKGYDILNAILEASEPINQASQTFLYQGYDVRVAWYVLNSLVPGTADDFIKEELISKLDITNFSWKKDVNGQLYPHYGANITSRDMLKFGKLVNDEGKWNGEQLIHKKYISWATNHITQPKVAWIPEKYHYGYYWYQTNLVVDGYHYDIKFAWGGGGQYIIAVKELDMVITITGNDRDDTILEPALSTILPAFDKKEYPPLEGPYMGQEPPGMIAKPFAQGIISREGWELEGVFAPGMKEFYYVIDRGEYTTYNPDNFQAYVVGFRMENNVWKKYTEFKRMGEMTFSPDGTRMHLAKGYRDRIGDEWTERKFLDPMINRKEWGIMRLSASKKGTYVFDDYKSKDLIRISTVQDGKRQDPVELGVEVNTGKYTAHPFIAPDESYLIWDSEREGGYGDSDLYISFKLDSGLWGPAINMGEGVNSPNWDAFASVTPDGKYILFNRDVDGDEGGNTDIYWVDAQIIETLRP
ncbi:MAG: serine hydrolase [Reichenbachiella sp.]